MYMSAKSYVPSSGRMYLSAISSIRSRSDLVNARRSRPLARAELVLHLVVAGREDLAQQLLEPDLANRATQSRHLQELLHFRHGLGHRLEPLRHLAQRPEAFAHVVQHAGLLGAPGGERPGNLLLGGDELVEPGAQLDELLLDEAARALPARAPQEDDRDERSEKQNRERDQDCWRHRPPGCRGRAPSECRS